MLKRLLFTRAHATIYEDVDYPGDPAPYVQIDAREFPVYLEMDEAEDLARAILAWITEHRERDARRVRDERRHAQQLVDMASDLAPRILDTIERRAGPTYLEIIQRARVIDAAMRARDAERAAARRAAKHTK